MEIENSSSKSDCSNTQSDLPAGFQVSSVCFSSNSNSCVAATENKSVEPVGALDSRLKLNVDSRDSAVYEPQNTTRIGTTPCVPVGVSDTPVARRTHSHCGSDSVDGLVLRLPDEVAGYVRCEALDVAENVKVCMEEQWSQLFKLGTKVKVKINGSHGVILKTHFIAKYASSMCIVMQLQRLMSALLESLGLWRLNFET